MLTGQMDLVPAVPVVRRTWWFEEAGWWYLMAPGCVVLGRVAPPAEYRGDRVPGHSGYRVHRTVGEGDRRTFPVNPATTHHATLELAKHWLEEMVGPTGERALQEG